MMSDVRNYFHPACFHILFRRNWLRTSLCWPLTKINAFAASFSYYAYPRWCCPMFGNRCVVVSPSGR